MDDFARTIAVDFDGCLCKNNWPDIGNPNTEAINELIRRRQEGDKVILWTCREGDQLDNAIRWCKEHGLEFDAVNDNLTENKEFFKNNSRKLYANEYWDDKAKAVTYREEGELDIEKGCLTLDEYQRLAQRTSTGHTSLGKVNNGLLGLFGEGGECADIYKKYMYQGHDFDVGHMIIELGDVMWYVAEVASGLGVSLEEVARKNIEKLKARYPDGFDPDKSINRVE